jgi:tetratricopeptide (TPR) repeat protein
MRRAFVFTLILAAAAESPAQETPAPVDFYGRVQPLLAIHCYKCHGTEVQKGGLRLDQRERALKGGESGNPGPAELARRVASKDTDEQMPPKGPRLSAAEVQVLQRWAAAGAPWPDRDDYWAFQPPKEQVPPTVKHPERVLNPIDQFLEARLEREGTKVAPPADRRSLLRRVYADLVGVPPTPEEADAFLRDSAPDAYEKLIDRLLADSRYGERWARHWLDLVRYADPLTELEVFRLTSPDYSSTLTAYYNRGIAYYHKGDNDQAIADYTLAITLNPKYSLAYNNRGLVYHAQGDNDQALAEKGKDGQIPPLELQNKRHRIAHRRDAL